MWAWPWKFCKDRAEWLFIWVILGHKSLLNMIPTLIKGSYLLCMYYGRGAETSPSYCLGGGVFWDVGQQLPVDTDMWFGGRSFPVYINIHPCFLGPGLCCSIFMSKGLLLGSSALVCFYLGSIGNPHGYSCSLPQRALKASGVVSNLAVHRTWGAFKES
jgi:hypothetical protein